MIIPAGHTVLIRPDKVEDKTKGGLFIPKTAQAREQHSTTKGVIIAIGETAWKILDDGRPWAKVGDRVAFPMYVQYEVEDDETKEKLWIVLDEDVKAILTEGEN